MNPQLIKGLTHTDPAQRRQSIIALGKSGDKAALPHLAQVYRTDPDAELRKLAKQAGQHLQRMLQGLSVEQSPLHEAPPPAPEPPREIDHIMQKMQQVAQSRAVHAEKRERRQLNPLFLMLLMLLVTLITIPVYLVLTNDQIRYNLTAPDAIALDPAGKSFPGALNGQLYSVVINARTSFYIQEPEGSPPADGWPLLVGIHGSGGSGRDMLYPARDASEKGILLVTMSFSPATPGGHEYETAELIAGIRAMLPIVTRLYPVNPDARVLFGFSMGGQATGGYVTAHPDDFDGAAVMGARQIEMPPASSRVRYLVVCGANDPRLPASQVFVSAMAERGKPVWKSEFTPGVGHSLTDGQMALVYELVASLQSR